MKIEQAIVLHSLVAASTGAAIHQANTRATAKWGSLGCYADNISGRALPNGAEIPGGAVAMTNEACQTACESAGYSIAGTEYGAECCKSKKI